MRPSNFILLMGLLFAMSGTIYCQELVYTPINPSFAGGNPFNASWLLASAQAQNKMTENRSIQPNAYSSDPLKDFQSTLQRQILSQLTTKLFQKTFGEDGLKTGKYEIGGFSVDISQASNGLMIQILDNATGNQTSILVPYY